nr:hypothetical protein [Tanacetum cinerariifolium]
ELYKNHRIQLLPIEHSAHVEDIVEFKTAIAQTFLYLRQDIDDPFYFVNLDSNGNALCILFPTLIRRDHQLRDEEGIDCLPTAIIFDCLNEPSDPLEHVADKAIYKELDDRLVRAATIASSLEAEQDSELCITLQSRVLDLEKTNTTQALKIESLKRRVKQLEEKQRSRTYKLKRLYKGRKIHDIDANEDITLVKDQDDEKMFDENDLQGKEVFVQEDVTDKEVNAAGEVNAASIATTISAAAAITTEEVTFSKALAELKALKPKVKGKAIMIEEPVKLKKKDQIMLDEEVSLMLQAELQAEFDKEQRLASESAQQEQDVNSALIEEWNDIQAKIDAEYLLAQRLQAKKQQELTGAEKLHCLCNSERREESSLQQKQQKKRGTNH